MEALQWLLEEGASQFGVDVERVAIGGTSAGGNLAASLVVEATTVLPNFRPAFLLLIVPVIDNTATPGNGRNDDLNAPWLMPARMLWYRKMYIPEVSTAREPWKSSPNVAPAELLAKCPRTWIAVSEYDLLGTEGLQFAEQLRRNGVQVASKVYEGSTHSILALNGVLAKGKELMQDTANVLNRVFRPSPT